MNERAALRRAVELARRARYEVEPNPMVGCVLLRDGQRIGEGWHRAYGGPHAEIEALASVAAVPAGTTAVVTLEPCSTRGKTGPCTSALLAAGVRRVVVGAVDPNPDHAGAGLDLLRAQGLEVELRDDPACAELLEPFRRALRSPRPHVLSKWAQSADGAVARLVDGHPEPVALSGAEARRRTHGLRAHVDGVLVGVGTVLADDPELTVREGWRALRPGRRIVLDPGLRTPLASRLATTADACPTWLLCAHDAAESREQALREQGCEVFRLPVEGELLPTALECLRAQGVGRILVEGGPRTHARLLGLGLVDDLALFLTPVELGAKALPALPDERLALEPEGLIARFSLTESRLEELGPDRLLLGALPRGD